MVQGVVEDLPGLFRCHLVNLDRTVDDGFQLPFILLVVDAGKLDHQCRGRHCQLVMVRVGGCAPCTGIRKQQLTKLVDHPAIVLRSGSPGELTDPLFQFHLVSGKATNALGQFLGRHGVFVGFPAEQVFVDSHGPVRTVGIVW